MNPFALIAAWYAAASITAYALFAWDKSRAARRGRRIRESTLHAIELLGGFPGAWAAIASLGHKNRKWRFLAVTAGITLLHAAAWTRLAWGVLRS
ncbi:MAG: DUF1294 domain-containing protein [Phycisphaeraceae bacterium]|nr:DUF1294 domain-containing protein [Phycisphaerae bacterium]MBX3391741.1 DUF1294 domain-containing protein [Phycisphaeraceae bacterium]